MVPKKYKFYFSYYAGVTWTNKSEIVCTGASELVRDLKHRFRSQTGSFDRHKWPIKILSRDYVSGWNTCASRVIKLLHKSINNLPPVIANYKIIQTGKLHLETGYSLNCIHTTLDNILILFVAYNEVILYKLWIVFSRTDVGCERRHTHLKKKRLTINKPWLM